MTAPILPQVPVLSAAFSGVFGEVAAILAAIRAEAEKAFPGSGKIIDDAEPKLAALQSTIDVPSIADKFASEIGSAWTTGQSPIVPDPTDGAGG
jgi:hypothetical protein